MPLPKRMGRHTARTVVVHDDLTTLPPELPKTWMPSRPLFSTTLPWTVVAIVAGSRRIPMSWLFAGEKPMLLSRMKLFSMMFPLEAAPPMTPIPS
jgi:hypothetical protein